MRRFLGLLHTTGRPFDERVLERILSQRCFRGPDAQNIVVERTVTTRFTYRQLSPGRQSARQPVSLDERYWLMGGMFGLIVAGI